MVDGAYSRLGIVASARSPPDSSGQDRETKL